MFRRSDSSPWRWFTWPFRKADGSSRISWVLATSVGLILLIVVMERITPANVVIAYGFVLPILLIATARNRRLMYLTLALCIAATYIGILRPTKPGRFQSAVINRTVVVGVLIAVAYFAMTREERKAREEAARAELALQSEKLLRANAQLVEMKDVLHRSARLAAAGQLAASVAHEVGTPLHSIAWHVQALGEESSMTPEMQKRIAIIDSEINRVVRSIKELLSSTRQRKPNPARLPMDRLVQSVSALMEPSFVGKGVSLKVEVGADAPVVRGDTEQLQQVLMNLMTNALAATNAGQEVRITVGMRAATTDEVGERRLAGEPAVSTLVTVTVRDTGYGMPEEHQKRAFEPFFTTKAIGDGTGLGLFLSREIVTAHGGSLSIESEIGKGTTVVISLPSSAGNGAEARVRAGDGT